MSLKFQHLSKYLRLEMNPIEVREFNGDKRAYFLAIFQEELSDKFIARYGKDFKSVLIFDAEQVYPVWQDRLTKSYRDFLKEDAPQTSIVLHVPKIYLATRGKEYIIVKIKKTKPQVGTKLQVLQELIQGEGKKLAIWNGKDQTFEVYEYSQWQKVGIRYRSER